MDKDLIVEESLKLLGLHVVRCSVLEQELGKVTAERDQAEARLATLLSEHPEG